MCAQQICDILRQWPCLLRVRLCSLWTLCVAKCYWTVYCHKSQSFQWKGATTIHQLYPSSSSVPERYVGLLGSKERNVSLRSWGIFNAPPAYRSLLPRWAGRAPAAVREWEIEVRWRSEGQSGGLSPPVLGSVLDTACGTGLEDASCLLFKLRI